jgi:hypothetical protein
MSVVKNKYFVWTLLAMSVIKLMLSNRPADWGKNTKSVKVNHKYYIL